MATNFFSQFPKLSYDVDGEGSYVNLTDISRTADISTFNEDKVSYYTYYDVNDGDRPDTVSQLLYGTPEHYWTLFILNDSLKAGLNNAWPLSIADFETMIAREYDKYSALTIGPQLQSIDSIRQQHSDFSIVPLDTQYLPYLRLSSPETQLTANIAFYDRRLLQLVIYNITPIVAGAYANTSSLDLRNVFLNSSEYIIQWINPYDPSTEAELYGKCQSLKTQWVNLVAVNFETVDDNNPYGKYVDLSAQQKELYVFNKRYMCPAPEYSWAFYRNAVYQYFKYDTLDSTAVLPVNAFDAVNEFSGMLRSSSPYYLKANGVNTSFFDYGFDNYGTGFNNYEATGMPILCTCPSLTFYNDYMGYLVNGFDAPYRSYPVWLLMYMTANGDGYGWNLWYFPASSEPNWPTGDITLVSIFNNDEQNTPAKFNPLTMRFGDGVPAIQKAIFDKTSFLTNTISFYEKEQLDNDAKRKIKVVRPDKIRDFSKTYFTVLNS
jgi:hypothetical protein